MKNFIFISPNFPANYRFFCRELKKNGLNVLGIGDQPYDELSFELKENLQEYFKVDSLELYDQVYRAVAFFIFKYGKIDWLESNNEYWLERDARLRTEFHITSGFQTEDIPKIKYKSHMKEFYKKAGIPTARYHMVDTYEGCLDFIRETGYPVIVKPDNGVGASDTRKLTNDNDLKVFFAEKSEQVSYIMEEYINGTITSYDAVIDSNGNPVFESGNITPVSIMDSVNQNGNVIYHIVKDLAEDVRSAGRRTAKSFGVKSRFVHFEFFRLGKDHESLGKKNELVALEVNMRPAGGFSTDMMNYAYNTDVYKIWADMIAFDSSTLPDTKHSFCAFGGRRDGKQFVLPHEKLIEKYKNNLKMVERLPDVIARAMGNQTYIATFKTEKELSAFYKDLLKEELPAPPRNPRKKRSSKTVRKTTGEKSAKCPAISQKKTEKT